MLIENQVTHKPQEFRWIADLGIGINLKKITLLAQLGGESPSDLRQRLAASDTPWQIRTMIDDSQLSASLQ